MESHMMGNYHVWFGMELFNSTLLKIIELSRLTSPIITAHAFIMIFFMVIFLLRISYLLNIIYLIKVYFNDIISKTEICLVSILNNINKNINYFNSFNEMNNKKCIENNNNFNENNNKPILPYKKFIIIDPYNNRDEIAIIAKKSKGVYVFEIIESNIFYVGSSINLYNRVCSYFIPSILANADRRVLHYFRKYGFENVKLTLYILSPGSTLKEIIELEQYYIDIYCSTGSLLNVDLVAGGRMGKHTPMSLEARERHRKMRGIAFFVYDTITHCLIFKFQSKQSAYDNIHINHTTLNNSLDNGILYLDRFMFSVEPITEFTFESLISLNDLINLIHEVQLKRREIQIRSKKIYAENIKQPNLSKIFNSINSFAKAVKGDRGTIRSYLNDTKKKDSLYRKQ